MEEAPFEAFRSRRRWSDNYAPRPADLGESCPSKHPIIEETPTDRTPGRRKRRWSDIFVPAAANSEEAPPPNSNTEQEPDSVEVAPRRSTRLRYRTSSESQIKELPKPKKLTETSSLKDIEHYYLDKRVKRLNPSLETIYEEPQQVKNEEVIMSSRKYRRIIDFKATNTKNSVKAKKRQRKAEIVLANCKRRKKVSLKFVKKKLEEIGDD